MTTFDDREDLYEKRFAHDQGLAFKADARHAKLFGLWAAEQLGLEGETAESYAKDVVKSSLEEQGDDDILKRVRPDFDAKNLPFSDEEIKRCLDEFMNIAMRQIVEEAD